MANYDSGVKGYIIGECTIKVHFPIDFRDNHDVCCKRCGFLSSNERICQLNKQVVFYPNKIGDNCPLIFRANNESEEE